MLGKQHTGFRYKLLGMLFLFFNCVCTAAPVIKDTSEDYKQVISLRLAQNPNAAESEDESRIAGSYVVQLTHFSFGKQHANHLYKVSSKSYTALRDISWPASYITATGFLSKPGYYTFLFRYKLF